MASTTSYIIAATPRTGSYLLCEGLEATEIAGRPTEVFSPDFAYVWRNRWSLADDISFADYLQAAVRHGTTHNGVYGLKIHWMQVAQLATNAGYRGESSGVLSHLFGETRFVNIVRHDFRAQALSYFRALTTNEWWQIKGVHNDQANGKPPVFSANAIRSLEKNLVEQQRCWKRFFTRRKINPLIVEYESLVEDYRGQVGRVLEFLGLDSEPAQFIPPPRLQRQADRVSARWRELMTVQRS